VFIHCVQVFDTSDLPGGVVNIVTGSRDHLSKYLTEHQDVDAMWWVIMGRGDSLIMVDLLVWLPAVSSSMWWGCGFSRETI
jgi:hypothetical protein